MLLIGMHANSDHRVERARMSALRVCVIVGGAEDDDDDDDMFNSFRKHLPCSLKRFLAAPAAAAFAAVFVAKEALP